jgi:CheY-like chemotaxis protein
MDGMSTDVGPSVDLAVRPILVIDDDALIRSLIAEWLAAEGYAVTTSAADRAPQGTRPAVVIVDLFRPREVAAERVRALREAYPGVPIIAISGHFRAGVRCEGPAAHELGVERVIAKPFKRDELLHTIRSLTVSHAADPG